MMHQQSHQNKCLEVETWPTIAKYFLEFTYKKLIKTICFNRKVKASIFIYISESTNMIRIVLNFSGSKINKR